MSWSAFNSDGTPVSQCPLTCPQDVLGHLNEALRGDGEGAHGQQLLQDSNAGRQCRGSSEGKVSSA
jgi:hypothetical protein